LRQPTASDLRMVIAILKTITDLERICEHANNVSEYVIYMVEGKDVRHLSVDKIEEILHRKN
jgi:phosphate transport system protein